MPHDTPEVFHPTPSKTLWTNFGQICKQAEWEHAHLIEYIKSYHRGWYRSVSTRVIRPDDVDSTQLYFTRLIDAPGISKILDDYEAHIAAPPENEAVLPVDNELDPLIEEHKDLILEIFNDTPVEFCVRPPTDRDPMRETIADVYFPHYNIAVYGDKRPQYGQRSPIYYRNTRQADNIEHLILDIIADLLSRMYKSDISNDTAISILMAERMSLTQQIASAKEHIRRCNMIIDRGFSARWHRLRVTQCMRRLRVLDGSLAAVEEKILLEQAKHSMLMMPS